MDKATVVDLVLKYPDERGDETAIIFLDIKGEEKHKVTFNGLKSECLTVAANLLPLTERKEVVLMLTEDQPNFVACFFGIMLAGCIPAPLAPFKNIKDRQGYGRMLRILKKGTFSCIVADEVQCALIAEVLERESLGHVRLISAESLKSAAKPHELPEVQADDIAYLQYTSGSTSEPKGVVLRHRNVLCNVAKMKRVFQRTEPVSIVGWIPFHHDMGLVGHLFSVLYESGLGVFMPASAFISSPKLWLEAISRYRANTSAAPNFAFEHCTRKVPFSANLDLSCWKYAYIGSETVSMPVMQQFYEKFGAAGFSRNSFKPVYGLAEITLLAAGGTQGLDELEDKILIKPAGKHTQRVLMPYLIDELDKITIAHTLTGEACLEGETGEILIESPSNSFGYYEDMPVKKPVKANIIHTGDIGFVLGRYLYLSGRRKEVVIIRGVNYAAEDLEWCARHQITELQTGSQTVCTSTIDETGERLLIFQEIHRHTNRETLRKISGYIKANLTENYGIVPAEVIFVPNGMMPRTRNYKVSRKECLNQYLAGDMQFIYTDVSEVAAADELTDNNDPVVIVGMACRFPGGADSPEKFWDLLASGVDAVTEVPLSRWDNDLFYDERPAVPGKVSTKWSGFIDNIDFFDPALFEISAYEAPELDPQQRLLLETSWRLIENTGVKKNELMGSGTGVFIGMSTNDYLYMKIKLSPGMEGFNAYSGLGNSNSVAANRLSYFYDLKGPSLTVDTACSSSLTALHLAAQSILNGNCTQAIAGGVNAILSPGPTITLSQFGMMSPEGRCKTFDASADGYVRAEGCGLVMLKRKSEAERDGNTILAVLNASAIGQDGHSPGITFPNGKAQYQLISQTLHKAGLAGKDIGYVEAHGTGTSSGDPVEVEQLKKLYGAAGSSVCYLGSVKANIGHLEAGAGIASIIKSVLMLQKGKVPPQIHIKTLNPKLQLDGTRLKISIDEREWEPNQPRRIAVSSFGFGGSLAHAILSAPQVQAAAAKVPLPSRFAQRNFVFSANTSKGLLEQAKVYSDWLGENPAIAIDDLCLTQAVCRSDLKYRKYFMVNSLAMLKEKLDGFIASGDTESIKIPQHGKVCFLFTGQGEHYIFMGKVLYQRFPVFRQAFDRCAVVAEREAGGTISLKEIAFEIKDTYFFHDRYMQPILFAVQYALGTLWQECGVMPDYLVGHSMGEYAAACLAGCFEPETGMSILLKRALLVESINNKGMMVTLFTGHEEIRKVMDAGRMQIAAINSDKKTVISGENDAVVEVMKHFEEQGAEFYHLKTSHAFHSQLMRPIADDLHEFVKQFSFKTPDKKWISAYKGAEMNEAPDADYWVGHLLGTINFKAAVEQLPKDELIHFIEIGPGASTLVAANETLHLKDALMLRSMNFRKIERTEDHFLFDSLGKLYQAGADIKWGAVLEGDIYPSEIPGQKFIQQSYWMEGVNAAKLAEFATPSARSKTVNQPVEIKTDAGIYSFQWKDAGQIPLNTEKQQADVSWIIVGETSTFAGQMAQQIKDTGGQVFSIGIRTKNNPKKLKPDFVVSTADDKEKWVEIIAKIIYNKSREDIQQWRLVFIPPDLAGYGTLDVAELEEQVSAGTGLLIPMLQALKKNALVLPVWIVTRRSQLVEPAENGGAAMLNICHAPVWGFAKTLFLEHPELRGGLIDIETDSDVTAVLAKINKPRNERVVALRNGVQYIEQITANKAAKATPEVLLRADGVHIITGGLGGLGLKCAAWVVDKGGRHLVLISRRKFHVADKWAGITNTHPDYSIVQQLLAMQQKGAKIEIVQLDVRDIGGLEKLFTAFKKSRVPVRGVIHAAGVNWFGKVMELDRDEFLHTLKTKVSATWAIHQLTLKHDLDCFILFSSVSALWGSVELSHYSAANQFMDMLSLYRHQAGLPSLCIDWGPWAEVGMSAEDREANVLQKLGFELMTPAAALSAMQKELVAGVALSLVANVNWKKFGTFVDFSLQPSLFAEVRPQAVAEVATAESGVDRILKSPPEKALKMIEDAVRMKLRNVMLIEASDSIDREQRFNFLGMDSLMSISFAAELEHYFGIKLPNTLAYNYPHIKAVSEFIFSLIYTEISEDEPDGLQEPVSNITSPVTDSEPGLYKMISRPATNAKIRLFCFPYLGAGASVYEKWAAFFDDHYELVAVQTPGREERSNVAPFVSMHELIDALLTEYTEPDGDFAFFGHSFGGLVAYEFYNALKEHGRKLPLKLFLSGCEAPLSPSKSRLHELPDKEFIDEIINKYDNAGDVLERKRALSNNPALLRADVQVLELYQSENQRIDVPLTVIAGTHDRITDATLVKSWLTLANADFTMKYINGGHDLVKEHGPELAGIIKSGLGVDDNDNYTV
ncbi:type I polyketide synthase [Mucilaginibacter sp. KACC 22063]|uniref:type I polyketide synthase n=1 Tax=Mucilaginibacter sp. KACC 22063 TaxID=3025666 RepID=UPI00236611A7|nr:type I polyketide synthase [Mucilaginibacter sp. KACC 22063]WDF57262.1 SDR family NAD(P)-dependent oxidoreductase [Mucilaginibacter sp. KACC 22063]